jgi:hypothetical protein
MAGSNLSHRRTDARAVDEQSSETEPLVVRVALELGDHPTAATNILRSEMLCA